MAGFVKNILEKKKLFPAGKKIKAEQWLNSVAIYWEIN